MNLLAFQLLYTKITRILLEDYQQSEAPLVI